MSVKEIITNAKKGKSQVEKILEKRTEEAGQEYEETRLQRLIAEEKAKIKAMQGEGKTVETELGSSFVGHIMQAAQVDPVKAKQFLSSLDENDLQKLAFLMAAESDRSAALMKLTSQPGTSVKDIIEIVKLVQPHGGGNSDLKAAAEVFKLGMEAASKNQPPQTPQPGAIEVFKQVGEIVKPFQDALKERDRELFENRMKLMEDKIINPLEWYKAQKTMAAELGMSGGGKGEIDLRLEEMRQNKELDMRKLEWEQHKWQLAQDADQKKWEQIKEIMEGPVGKVLNVLGEAGADRVRGDRPRKSEAKPQQIQCPACKNIFFGDPNASRVICGHCGAVLEKASPPHSSPSESPPPPQESKPQPSSSPAAEQTATEVSPASAEPGQESPG